MDKKFWTEKYRSMTTGWDIGSVSTPIKNYIDQLDDKNLKILIPGVGNGYELEYLWANGFKNAFGLDITEEPLDNFSDRVPLFPKKQLLCTDFFKISDQNFDLIIEQTFFCALNPSLRTQYVEQMYRLLKKGGKLSGLFFNFELDKNGPPFGGNKNEYLTLFNSKLKVLTMEECYNSIPPRQGNELFFIAQKH